MFVKEVNKANELSSSKVKKAKDGENFSAYLNNVGKNERVNVTSKTNFSVNEAIFAAQMVGDEEEQEKKKKLLKRANGLLEKLESIRNALLDGYISMDKLVEISRFVKEQKITSEDEKLKIIVEEIELRVEVELAKLMK
ncbi:MAG: flagellar assembly protein FliX [Alphaproteobacteria bacterium]|nr:flagellar assembly protein FliX [Alphaproteobacteria bacterium]